MKNKLKILYEDNHIIVVIKDENVLSQKDNTNDPDLLSELKVYIKEKYHKPGNVYLGLVHRLDRPTGGIMVFARTSKAAARLSKQIRDKKMEKRYLALVEGSLEDKQGTFLDYLIKGGNNSYIVNNTVRGAQEAILSYQVLKEIDKLSLVEVFLKTGRHHQIRVQFKAHGHPLYGDKRYGNALKGDLHLYAYYLSFEHPVTKKQCTFINYPKGRLWDKFLKDKGE